MFSIFDRRVENKMFGNTHSVGVCCVIQRKRSCLWRVQCMWSDFIGTTCSWIARIAENDDENNKKYRPKTRFDVIRFVEKRSVGGVTAEVQYYRVRSGPHLRRQNFSSATVDGLLWLRSSDVLGFFFPNTVNVVLHWSQVSKDKLYYRYPK